MTWIQLRLQLSRPILLWSAYIGRFMNDSLFLKVRELDLVKVITSIIKLESFYCHTKLIFGHAMKNWEHSIDIRFLFY